MKTGDSFILSDVVEFIKDGAVGTITLIERILPSKKRQAGKFDHTKPNNFENIYSVTLEDGSVKRVFGYQVVKKP